MNKEELFDKVKGMIGDGKLDEAKGFLEEHKDDLGEYFEKAKDLLGNLDSADGIMDKVKGLFGK